VTALFLAVLLAQTPCDTVSPDKVDQLSALGPRVTRLFWFDPSRTDRHRALEPHALQWTLGDVHGGARRISFLGDENARLDDANLVYFATLTPASQRIWGRRSGVKVRPGRWRSRSWSAKSARASRAATPRT